MFSISDSITTEGGLFRAVVAGVVWDPSDGAQHQLLRDWQLVLELNRLLEARGFRRPRPSPPAGDIAQVTRALGEAEEALKARLGELDLPFRVPVVGHLAVLWPGEPGSGSSRPSDDELLA
jgi:hypothetical protein